jgi:hypothetical protein
MYVWQLNKAMGITCLVVGAFFFAAYYWSIMIPAMRDHAFDNYPIFSHQPPVVMAKAAIRIARGFTRFYHFVLYYVTEAALFPGVQAISDKGILHHIHEKKPGTLRLTTPQMIFIPVRRSKRRQYCGSLRCRSIRPIPSPISSLALMFFPVPGIVPKSRS